MFFVEAVPKKSKLSWLSDPVISPNSASCCAVLFLCPPAPGLKVCFGLGGLCPRLVV